MASILLSLIPFVLLFIFNLFIYCLVKRSPLPRSSSRQRREQGVARILILIILVYIACHGIITYINIIEIWGIMRGTLSTTQPQFNPLNQTWRATFVHRLFALFTTLMQKMCRFRQTKCLGSQHEYNGLHLSPSHHGQLLL